MDEMKEFKELVEILKRKARACRTETGGEAYRYSAHLLDLTIKRHQEQNSPNSIHFGEALPTMLNLETNFRPTKERMEEITDSASEALENTNCSDFEE